MKRAILVTAGTIAGTAAVLAYQPGSLFGTDAAPVAGADAAAAPSAQSYAGDAIDTHWGPVQVSVVVEGETITSVTGTQTSTDHHSEQIASYAIPQLQQQAVAAQSASLDGVSGASYTTDGFEQSLASALAKAGLA